jgi:hypothetical protein
MTLIADLKKELRKVEQTRKEFETKVAALKQKEARIRQLAVEFPERDSHRVHYVRRPFQREPDFGVTMKSKSRRLEKNQSGTRSGQKSLPLHLFRLGNMETAAARGSGCSLFTLQGSRRRRARTTIPGAIQPRTRENRRRKCRASKRL